MTHENWSSSLKPDYLVPTTGLRETCSENQDSQAAREYETTCGGEGVHLPGM